MPAAPARNPAADARAWGVAQVVEWVEWEEEAGGEVGGGVVGCGRGGGAGGGVVVEI